MRDGSTGSGLLIVDGQQYPFSVAELWKSDKPPAAGMVVEVEFEQYGKIRAVYVVTESQPSKDRTRSWSKAVAGVGIMNPIAAALLLLSWTLLTAVSVQTALATQDFTFWQVLVVLDSGKTSEAMRQTQDASGAGLYGFLGLLAVAGPILQATWKEKGAALGGLLPLVFMAAVGLRIRSDFEAGFSGNEPAIFNSATKQMVSVSLGAGAYISALICLYFAVRGIMRLLSASAREKRDQQNVRGAAA